MKSKNHFVSKFYLENWSSNGRLFAYRLIVPHDKVPTWIECNTKSEATRKSLYVTPEEEDYFEKVMDSKIENPASDSLYRLVNRMKLAPRDWEHLIALLALHDLRTIKSLKRHLDNTGPLFESVVKSIIAEFECNLPEATESEKSDFSSKNQVFEIPVSFEVHRDDIKKEAFIRNSVLVGRRSWLSEIESILENSLELLKKHRWTIVRPSSGFSWPTSDSPVIKLNYRAADDYDLNGGWGVNKGNIFFPLTPKLMMMTEIGSKSSTLPKKFSTLSENQTLDLQKYIIENAFGSVYSSQPIAGIEMIRQRTVDRNAFMHEREFFSSWDERNRLLEKDFRTKTTVKSNDSSTT